MSAPRTPAAAQTPLAPLPRREEVAEAARGQGLGLLAALPYHYPRALVRAHGFHAMEVWAPPSTPADSGARHFQAYACPIVVKGAAFLLDGGFGRVDAVLVPHGCDALQGLGSVLRDFVDGRPPVLTLYPPRGRRAVDARYLRAEFARLGDDLGALSGRRPNADDWAAAFAAEDAADAALARLYAHRGRLAISDREFYEVVRAREYLLPDQFIEAVAALPPGTPRRGGVGIVLSGIVADPLELLDVLHEAGAHVAADDLGSGSRRLLPAPASTAAPADPIGRCVEAFLAGPPDPTRGDPIAARAEHLLALVRTSGSRGVLVLDPTFCEPEQFYLPGLRAALGAEDIPLLFVEHESSGTLDARLRGRVEAFVETLTTQGVAS